MRVIADENMPGVREHFSPYAEVVCLPGRTISRADLAGADALLVRSVTPVTRALLQGTPVRFVGSATIGTDHIDSVALAEMGVAVAAAPGCNAQAVAEYVAAALLVLSVEQGWQPEARHVGIVGLGNVGQAVSRLLMRLGFTVLGCDPLRPATDPASPPRRALDALLDEVDILCLHTPLTREGPHATWHLLGPERLSRLRPGAVLLNAGRGAVIDNQALCELLERRRNLTAVLDVWEGEPAVLPELLARVRFGTPHVAGYSQEGKWRGTAMVHAAFCAHFGLPCVPVPMPAGQAPVLDLPAPDLPASAQVASLFAALCPLARDDAALRASIRSAAPREAFDALRRDYPPRFECASAYIKEGAASPHLALLQGLGFRMA
ncbi:MAG: 4-phosphoerythronate dehydrogenase [Moraxellaceae bacterium]